MEEVLRGIPDIKDPSDFDKLLTEYKIGNPNNPKGQFCKTYAFNLMFSSSIGPLGD